MRVRISQFVVSSYQLPLTSQLSDTLSVTVLQTLPSDIHRDPTKDDMT